jgi:hypothetical protein
MAGFIWGGIRPDIPLSCVRICSSFARSVRLWICASCCLTMPFICSGRAAISGSSGALPALRTYTATFRFSAVKHLAATLWMSAAVTA